MDFASIEMTDLATFVYQLLKKHGIEAVLVGGSCVSVYSNNAYHSYDLDFVVYEGLKSIEKILYPYGFRRNGRCFTHKNCPYLLDFVNPPTAVGKESIKNFHTQESETGIFKLLTPTDCVKDRLSSYFYWNDHQALEQAVLVAKDQSIDMNNLKDWAKAEGYQNKLKDFLNKLI